MKVTDPASGEYFRPELPASLDRPHGWGQASSHFSSQGKSLVWCRPTGAELDFIAAQPGARIIGQCCPGADAARMVTALRTAPATWPEMAQIRAGWKGAAKGGPGSFEATRARYENLSARAGNSHAGPLGEFIAAYRALAEAEEKKLLAQRGRTRWIVAVLSALGAAAGLALVYRILGQEGVALGMAVLAQDAFTDSDSVNLTDRTMTDGFGTWAVSLGDSWFIISNEARGTSGDATYSDSLGSLTDADISVTMRATGTNCGVIARHTVGEVTHYIGQLASSPRTNALREYSMGSATELGTGSTFSLGDVFKLRCDGTSISLFVNGALDVGPVTDSTHSSGYAGMYNGDYNVDDFLVESLGAGGGGAKPRLLGGLVEGGILMGGRLVRC